MSTFSKFFLFLIPSIFLSLSNCVSCEERHSRIVLVFHFIYFASSPSKIISFLLCCSAICLLSRVCFYLDGIAVEERRSRVRIRDTRRDNKHFLYQFYYSIFIYLSGCLLLPPGCCFPAAFIFLSFASRPSTANRKMNRREEDREREGTAK